IMGSVALRNFNAVQMVVWLWRGIVFNGPFSSVRGLQDDFVGTNRNDFVVLIVKSKRWRTDTLVMPGFALGVIADISLVAVHPPEGLLLADVVGFEGIEEHENEVGRVFARSVYGQQLEGVILFADAGADLAFAAFAGRRGLLLNTEKVAGCAVGLNVDRVER